MAQSLGRVPGGGIGAVAGPLMGALGLGLVGGAMCALCSLRLGLGQAQEVQARERLRFGAHAARFSGREAFLAAVQAWLRSTTGRRGCGPSGRSGGLVGGAVTAGAARWPVSWPAI
ncbi:MAG: hypothetical protein HY319_18200 [Armatimonadetes bacterium]|nr:hypothetical protein [Armatimonadota bacterium]